MLLEATNGSAEHLKWAVIFLLPSGPPHQALGLRREAPVMGREGAGGSWAEGAREGVSRGGGGASRVCGWGWVWQGLGMVGSGYCKDWLSLQLGLGMIGI